MWAMVLAGGRSRRMGRPKQELPFGGKTLLERVVRLAEQAVERVILIGDPEAAERLGVGTAADLHQGEGPLSALVGGLQSCPEGLHALLACDLPFLEPALLGRLAELAGDADAVVPEVEGRLHPLCALYRSSCLEPARQRIAQGERRMQALLDGVKVRIVETPEVAPLSLARSVTNLNTPEEYRRALEALRRRRL